MFPKEIEQMIQANMVGFNPKLASGLATHELKKSKSYIDEVVRALSVSFPWYVKYVGIRSLTPDEEFDILTRSRNQNHVVDIA